MLGFDRRRSIGRGACPYKIAFVAALRVNAPVSGAAACARRAARPMDWRDWHDRRDARRRGRHRHDDPASRSSRPAPIAAATLLAVVLACWRRSLPRLAACLLLGLAWGCLRGHELLARVLPPQLEGRDLALRLCVEGLPLARHDARGESWRLRARVLDPLPGASGPLARWQGRRVELGWYGAAAFAPGEAWAMTLRLRAPRGFANPGGLRLPGLAARAGHRRHRLRGEQGPARAPRRRAVPGAAGSLALPVAGAPGRAARGRAATGQAARGHPRGCLAIHPRRLGAVRAHRYHAPDGDQRHAHHPGGDAGDGARRFRGARVAAGAAGAARAQLGHARGGTRHARLRCARRHGRVGAARAADGRRAVPVRSARAPPAALAGVCAGAARGAGGAAAGRDADRVLAQLHHRGRAAAGLRGAAGAAFARAAAVAAATGGGGRAVVPAAARRAVAGAAGAAGQCRGDSAGGPGGRAGSTCRLPAAGVRRCLCLAVAEVRAARSGTADVAAANAPPRSARSCPRWRRRAMAGASRWRCWARCGCCCLEDFPRVPRARCCCCRWCCPRVPHRRCWNC